MARRRREGTAVAVELLLAPPASGTLDPDAVELAVNTDKLRAAGASPGRPPPRLARNTLENRILWDDLPGGLKESISARTGPVTSGHAAADGQNSPLAAVLDTRDGKVFVKGLPSDHRLVITQAREAVAAPLAKGISPGCCSPSTRRGGNVLISQSRAWLVDWAWATPAQSWIDQGYWVIRLIAHGHTVAEAEAIAAGSPPTPPPTPPTSPCSPART